jgi:hypothetical protein
MPGKEGQQIGLAALKKSGDHESEKTGKEKEDHDKDICDRRSEKAGDFAPGDRENMA